MRRQRAALMMRRGLQYQLLGRRQRERLEYLVDVNVDVLLDDAGVWPTDRLADIDILITGWGAPRFTPIALAAAPRLGLVAHAAGSVKHFLDPQVWDRGVAVSSAAAANATPVAEFTLAMILLAGKDVFPIAARYRGDGAFIDLPIAYPEIGNRDATVGIIGASRIGRAVCELLRPFDLDVVVYDPYLDDEEAAGLGAERVSLDELLRRSRIVSIHAPDLPETRHLVDSHGLSLMQDGATLINTARAALVDHAALEGELISGRINAILDVSEPEPLGAGHVLFELPNVFTTPHLAGAQGTELRRLGELAVDEVGRFVRGEPLQHAIRADHLATIA